jgi:hypothetical protein
MQAEVIDACVVIGGSYNAVVVETSLHAAACFWHRFCGSGITCVCAATKASCTYYNTLIVAPFQESDTVMRLLVI